MYFIFLICLFSINICGSFNSSLKLQLDKNYLNLGYLNLYFFLKILKKILSLNFNGVSIFFLLKKKYYSGTSFAKADFKYKISKHLISKFSKHFKLIIFFSIENYLIFNKNLSHFLITKNLFSNVYLNIFYIKICNVYNNIKFFTI